MVSFSFFLLLWATLACTPDQSYTNGEKNFLPSSILVFTKTEGYHHDSIEDGVALFNSFDEDITNLSVTATEDASLISEETLKSYGAVIFLNTTGDVLNEIQQQALKSFIQNGGGFMGVHAATDTEYHWAWYGQMIGAYFDSHPAVQEAKMYVLQNSHPSTEYLPGVWRRTDEWYNFRDIQDYINPLINLDESTYEGGTNGTNHPVAWYHEFEGGRVFYTAGGHTPESYNEPLFRRHLMGGIKYVLDIGT